MFFVIFCLIFLILGCSEDTFVNLEVTTQEAEEINSTELTKRGAESDTLVMIEDCMIALMSAAGFISDPSLCVISSADEVQAEIALIQTRLDIAVASENLDEVIVARENAKALLESVSHDCIGLRNIRLISEEMVSKFPSLQEMEKPKLRELFFSYARNSKTSPCEENCAATAVFAIAMIERNDRNCMGIWNGVMCGSNIGIRCLCWSCNRDKVSRTCSRREWSSFMSE